MPNSANTAVLLCSVGKRAIHFSDLGGGVRIAPQLYHYRDDPEKLVAASMAQTVMTYNHPLVAKVLHFLPGSSGRS